MNLFEKYPELPFLLGITGACVAFIVLSLFIIGQA